MQVRVQTQAQAQAQTQTRAQTRAQAQTQMEVQAQAQMELPPTRPIARQGSRSGAAKRQRLGDPSAAKSQPNPARTID